MATVTSRPSKQISYQTPRMKHSVTASDAHLTLAFLQMTYIVIPFVAGLDKFFNMLTSWDRYLSPVIANHLPVSEAVFMRGVGVVEIMAAMAVAFFPRVGGYVVAGWLGCILINLLSIPGYFDVVIRDLGLAVGAIAFARLSPLLSFKKDGSL